MLRCSDQKIGELLPGELRAGVVEGSVVIGAEEAQWCDGFDAAEIDAEFQGVFLDLPGDCVEVLISARLGDGGEAVGVERGEIAEVKLRHPVEVEVGEALKTRGGGEGLSVEGVRLPRVVQGEAEAEFIGEAED